MPRGSTSASDKKKGDTPSPVTIEGLSDDQAYSLTEQHRQRYERLMVAKKAANKAVLDFGKIIKADLGDVGLADIKTLIDLSTPEGEAKVKAEMDRQARVMRWMNIQIGTQESLFGEDRTPAVDKAKAEGKRQGLAGETMNNPHHHTTEAHRAHNEGHAEGQAILAKGFKQTADKDAAKTKEDVHKSAALGSTRPSFETVN